MEFRVATIEDIDQILDMLIRFYGESVYSEISPPDIDKVVLHLTSWIEGDSSDVLYCPGHGCLGISSITSWYSDESSCQELFWYVEPEHRGSQVGYILLRLAEEWTKAVGNDVLFMSTNKNTHPWVSAFLEDKGYSEVETAYLKEL